MRRSAWPRRLGILVLAASMLMLAPLAYADPPDPTWLSGYWDDDDFDDVVGYITSTIGLLQAPVACASVPVAPRKGLRPTGLPAVAVVVPRRPSNPRAPPFS
jgi:hypothetical protein